MKNFPLPHNYYFAFILLCLIGLPSIVHAEANCTCEPEDKGGNDKTETMKYKIVAIIAILIASTIGVCIPLLGKTFPALSPEKDIFFIIKAFAAGVILSTGFIHVLPDAFDKLTSPCLKEHPWGDFPFTGFVAMLSAIGTLMIDCFATAYFRKLQFDMNEQDGVVNEEGAAVHDGHVHVHTHSTHGLASSGDKDHLLRQRVISQVLELGIVVHSVIIGISLGASVTLKTIRPLVAALTFHQFFEGMGLGGCISQAKFKIVSMMIMVFFFSLTTPIGIVIGVRITNVYDEDGSTALIVEGVLNATSAGILIYMSLVDLLATDFMNPRIQTDGKLQIGVNVSLLLGTGFMSLLAKWA